MEYGLLIVFYYGFLHALGPDHLSAIALFSVGKNKKEALLLSLLFAVGHGLTLYLLAIILGHTLSDSILSYGDLISSAAIVLVGAHLIYLVLKNEIIINKHEHKEKSHIHIHYKGRHFHDKKTLLSTGILMGFGGFRGMLVTLSLVANGKVGVDMIVAFVLGVSVVFGVFGYFVYLLDERFANSLKGIRIVIISIAVLSISIGLTTFVKVLNNV
jgi:ABC-type nickel/cobalt efflux system permease component RcnA